MFAMCTASFLLSFESRWLLNSVSLHYRRDDSVEVVRVQVLQELLEVEPRLLLVVSLGFGIEHSGEVVVALVDLQDVDEDAPASGSAT